MLLLQVSHLDSWLWVFHGMYGNSYHKHSPVKQLFSAHRMLRNISLSATYHGFNRIIIFIDLDRLKKYSTTTFVAQLQLWHLHWLVLAHSMADIFSRMVQVINFCLREKQLQLSKHISVWMTSTWITLHVLPCRSTSSIVTVNIHRARIMWSFDHNRVLLYTVCLAYT
jgi:hypothetical protein